MKKSILKLSLVALFVGGLISCNEENTKLENLEDKLEERSDDLEDASDDIGDAADDMEDALDSFRDALQEIDNPEDRKALRQRVNEIFDQMELEMQS